MGSSSSRYHGALEIWRLQELYFPQTTHTYPEYPLSQTDIDGSQVAQVYYRDNNLERIVRYCEQDVLAVAQIILRFARRPLLTDDEIAHVSAKE